MLGIIWHQKNMVKRHETVQATSLPLPPPLLEHHGRGCPKPAVDVLHRSWLVLALGSDLERQAAVVVQTELHCSRHNKDRIRSHLAVF